MVVCQSGYCLRLLDGLLCLYKTLFLRKITTGCDIISLGWVFFEERSMGSSTQKFRNFLLSECKNGRLR